MVYVYLFDQTMGFYWSYMLLLKLPAFIRPQLIPNHLNGTYVQSNDQGLPLRSYLHRSLFAECTHAHNTHTNAQYTHRSMFTITYRSCQPLPYTNTLCSIKKWKNSTKRCFWRRWSCNNKRNNKQYTACHPSHCTQHVTLQTPCLHYEWVFNEANTKLDVKLGLFFISTFDNIVPTRLQQ